MMKNSVFIGFGEAAQAFGGMEGWAGPRAGYDLKVQAPTTRAAKQAEFSNLGFTSFNSVAEALSDADQILSLVTADQALAAARACAASLRAGAFYFDMNSVSPGTKRCAAEPIEKAGGKYVDVAIMAPVHPAGLFVPLLVSGPYADEAVEHLKGLGFSQIRAVGQTIGQASSIKMIRSTMIKGMEALTTECLLAADAAGLVDEMVGTFGADWIDKANYNLERMMRHGLRRAAEMEEAAMTLDELGVEPLMVRASIRRQRNMGALKISAIPDDLDGKLRHLRNVKERVA